MTDYNRSDYGMAPEKHDKVVHVYDVALGPTPRALVSIRIAFGLPRMLTRVNLQRRRTQIDVMGDYC